MIDDHLRGTRRAVCELLVTGEVRTAKPVNALLWVTDDDEGVRFRMVKERLKNANLCGVAVLTLIDDGGGESISDGPREHSIGSLGVQSVTNNREDVIKGPDSGAGLACGEVCLDFLVQQCGGAVCFGEEAGVGSRCERGRNFAEDGRKFFGTGGGLVGECEDGIRDDFVEEIAGVFNERESGIATEFECVTGDEGLAETVNG